MENNPCTICHMKPSAFLCFCGQIQICMDCLPNHLLSNPSVIHNPVSLTAGKVIETMKSEADAQKQEKDESGEHVKYSSKQVRERLEDELTRLNEFQTKALDHLYQIRQQWLDEIMNATKEIELLLRMKCETLAQHLRETLADLDECPSPSFMQRSSSLELPRSSDPYTQIDLDKERLNFDDLIQELIPVGNERSDGLRLYKFFGGQGSISIFDPVTEQVIHRTQVAERFLHNCSWTVGPFSMIYITGGSLSGQSRDDVLCYSLRDNSISHLHNMIYPRRSHASVVFGGQVYVFGGIDAEEKLDTCEVYSIAVGQWTKLPNMNYSHAYLGCTIYQGAIFLAGGSYESVLEVFNPESNSFLSFSLPDVHLTEACSLLSLDNSILIFHGNYQGEVFEYRPEAGSGKKLADMCHGNSWSSCPPVIYENRVYSVRSDTVFKFELNSLKSCFLMRIGKMTAGKAGKRRSVRVTL